MRNGINFYLGRFLVVLMMFMSIDVLWGVFTRYALGNQAEWSEELARFLLIWIGILGAAYALGQNMHLTIDLLSSKLGQEARISQDRIIKALIILNMLKMLCASDTFYFVKYRDSVRIIFD